MLAYKYDEKTKEYLGTQEAQKNPLEGGYLLPANSTFTVVPEYGENEIPVFGQKKEEQTIEKEVPNYDEEGNPIIIEYEDKEVVIDYDEDGNPTGMHEITVIKQKQQTHIETETIIVVVDFWEIQPDFRGQWQVKLDDITFSKIDYIGEVKEGYQFITNEIFENYIADNDRYKVIDGVFTDIIDTDEYKALKLKKAKKAKYNEANQGAKSFLESGNALFEFESGKHIEATDGNIAKLTAYALAFVTEQLSPTDTVAWNTKEDETVELTADEIAEIITGLGKVQAFVWSVQFPAYVKAVEQAKTVDEIEEIKIEYTSEMPIEE